MKTIKYVPESCQGENKAFDGFLELRLPNYDECCEYGEEVLGRLKSDGEQEKISDKIAVMRKLVALTKKHYVVVNLKNLSTGEELKSFEDLSYDREAFAILNEVGMFILNGGNPKGPSKPL